MRASSDMPSPPRPANSRRGEGGRLRIFGIVAIAGFFFLTISMRGIAGFYTDYLWFDALNLTAVWSEILLAKVLLAVIFVGFFFALMWLNLYLADRLAPAFRTPGPEEQILARYHDVVGGRSGLVRFGVSALFSLSAGVGASAQWNNWILFRNRVDFGETDLQFGRDIGFYVFQLPFLTFLVDWLFTAFLISFIVTVGAHYVNGGIRLQAPGDERVTPQVKGHLSVLLAMMALVKAADYWLSRFELTVSRNGVVDGATFTDVTARLPVLNLLILIAFFAAALFVVNIRLRGWVLPAVAVGLWLVVSIVMQGIYPFSIQRLRVAPSEANREAAYIARNIDATRRAYGLDEAVLRDFTYRENLTADDILANADILNAVPLLDRAIVDDAFRLEQAELEFYSFPTEVDVDRYTIDGEVIPMVLGARSLNVGGLSSPSWESDHVTFTHGNGVAVAPINEVERQGPKFIIGNVPVENQVAEDVVIEQPRIYHGEGMSGYSIVNATVDEVDFLDAGRVRVGNRYDGTGGVRMGGLFRQISFALRFSSIDPLISSLVNSESKVMYIRDIEDRLQTVAPFLEFDADPYPVIAEGRIFYVVDAYTATSRYPYSQRADTEALSDDSGLDRNLNYVRNSVKAAVDTYDGTIFLYVVDDEDPIVKAYESAFPELFTPVSEAPADLAAHFRYPEDMFVLQTNMYARYQISNPQQFYEEFGGWDVAQDPGGVQSQNSTTVLAADGVSTRDRENRVDPYYMYMRLPEEPEADFVLMRSYVEVSDDDRLKEMTAFVAGAGDWGEDDYGNLIVYRIPSGIAVDGPALSASDISSQNDISEKISLLDVEGTEVEWDDLIIVPIEDSLFYVRPFYVTPTGTKLPALEWVVAAYGDSAVMCPTYNETLIALFGVGLPGEAIGNFRERCIGDLAATGPTDPTTPNVDNSGDASPDATPTPAPDAPDIEGLTNAEALARVNDLLTQADRARLRGDLATYQSLVSEALNLLNVFEPVPIDEGEPA